MWSTQIIKDHKGRGKFANNFIMERSALAVFRSVLLVLAFIVLASLSGFA